MLLVGAHDMAFSALTILFASCSSVFYQSNINFPLRTDSLLLAINLWFESLSSVFWNSEMTATPFIKFVITLFNSILLHVMLERLAMLENTLSVPNRSVLSTLSMKTPSFNNYVAIDSWVFSEVLEMLWRLTIRISTPEQDEHCWKIPELHKSSLPQDYVLTPRTSGYLHFFFYYQWSQ